MTAQITLMFFHYNNDCTTHGGIDLRVFFR